MIINSKDYDLRFGIRFLEETQKIYCKDGVNINGQLIKQNIGWGANMLAAHLKSNSAVPIAICIQCATAHLANRPSLEDIDDYITEEVEKGKSLEQLCEHFLALLQSAPLVRDGVRLYLKAFEALEKLQEMQDQTLLKQAMDFAKSEKTPSSASGTKRKQKLTPSNTPTT